MLRIEDRLHAHRDRRGGPPHPPAGDRAGGAGQGVRRSVGRTAGSHRRGAGQPAGGAGRDAGPLAVGEGGHRHHPDVEGGARRPEHRAGSGVRPGAGRRDPLRQAARTGAPDRRCRSSARGAPDRPADAERGGRPRRRGLGGVPLDRGAGHPPHGGGDRQAPSAGVGAWPASHRPRGAGAPGGIRHPPQPGRAVRPRPAYWIVPVHRPHRGGQNRTGPHAGRFLVRRRAGHGPHRHVGVHGAPQRVPSHRRAPRLCRVRRGGPAHRGGTEAALRGGAAGRDRKGPQRRFQRAAPAAGRRPANRRAGPNGGLSPTRC